MGRQILTRELLVEVLSNHWKLHESVVEAYLRDIERLGWLASGGQEAK